MRNNSPCAALMTPQVGVVTELYEKASAGHQRAIDLAVEALSKAGVATKMEGCWMHPYDLSTNTES